MHPNSAELVELVHLIDSGKIKVMLDRAFPFAQIGEAMAYLGKGHAKGKVVVGIASECIVTGA